MSVYADDCEPVGDYLISDRTSYQGKHRCSACRERIATGSTFVLETWEFEGEWEWIRRCSRCERIYQHLRERMDSGEFPDNRLNCGHSYEERWGEPPPDEIAALAFALPGELEDAR